MSAEAGRNERGRYQRDDAMLRDAVDHLAQALSLILPVLADIGMDAQDRITRATDAMHSVNAVFELVELIDEGEKPGKDQP